MPQPDSQIPCLSRTELSSCCSSVPRITMMKQCQQRAHSGLYLAVFLCTQLEQSTLCSWNNFFPSDTLETSVSSTHLGTRFQDLIPCVKRRRSKLCHVSERPLALVGRAIFYITSPVTEPFYQSLIVHQNESFNRFKIIVKAEEFIAVLPWM